MNESASIKHDALSDFMEKEREWLNNLVQEYPRQIPIKPLADHWGCEDASVRAAIESSSTFGVYWRKVGAKNHAYLIPTGLFIMWYTKANFV